MKDKLRTKVYVIHKGDCDNGNHSIIGVVTSLENAIRLEEDIEVGFEEFELDEPIEYILKRCK